MVDTIPVEDSSALMQGDIIIWPRRHAGWNRYGVILTADCDIENSKTQSVISYAPLLDFENYVSDVIIPEIADSELNEHISSTANQINRLRRMANPDSINISSSSIFDWICSDGVDVVVESLEPLADDERKKLRRKIDVLKAAAELKSNIVPKGNKLAFVAKYLAVKNKTSIQVEAPHAQQRIQSKLNSLPDNAFIITSVPGVENSGLIAMLNYVKQINIRHVKFRLSDLAKGDCLRIARLEKDFKYGLAQRFGNVFTRIGFVDEYDKRCKTMRQNYEDKVKLEISKW